MDEYEKMLAQQQEKAKRAAADAAREAEANRQREYDAKLRSAASEEAYLQRVAEVNRMIDLPGEVGQMQSFLNKHTSYSWHVMPISRSGVYYRDHSSSDGEDDIYRTFYTTRYLYEGLALYAIVSTYSYRSFFAGRYTKETNQTTRDVYDIKDYYARTNYPQAPSIEALRKELATSVYKHFMYGTGKSVEFSESPSVTGEALESPSVTSASLPDDEYASADVTGSFPNYRPSVKIKPENASKVKDEFRHTFFQVVRSSKLLRS